MPDLPLENGARVTDPEREGRRIVDAHIPGAALKRGEVACVAIARQLLDFARPVLRIATAVEESELVTASERVSHLMRPDESGASEDEDPQGLRRWLRLWRNRGLGLAGRCLLRADYRGRRQSQSREARRLDRFSSCRHEAMLTTTGSIRFRRRPSAARSQPDPCARQGRPIELASRITDFIRDG